MKKAGSSIWFFVCWLSFLAWPVFPVSATEATAEAIKRVDTFIKDDMKAGGEMVTTSNINVLSGSLISWVMGLVGTAALLIFIYNGIMWMIAEDNAGKIKTAKRGMIWAAVGLVAIFLTYLGVQTLLEGYNEVLFKS